MSRRLFRYFEIAQLLPIVLFWLFGWIVEELIFSHWRYCGVVVISLTALVALGVGCLQETECFLEGYWSFFPVSVSSAPAPFFLSFALSLAHSFYPLFSLYLLFIASSFSLWLTLSIFAPLCLYWQFVAFSFLSLPYCLASSISLCLCVGYIFTDCAGNERGRFGNRREGSKKDYGRVRESLISESFTNYIWLYAWTEYWRKRKIMRKI